MGSPPVIVDRPIPNRHLQMAFVERKQEVETFATKVAAESFAHRVRLGGPQRRPQNPYTHIGKTSVDIRREYAVAIVDDEGMGMVARQRFPELLQRPFRRGMGRGVEVENLAGSDLHDDENVEGPEGGGDHHEEVAGYHDLGMIADEGQPTLFRVRRAHRTLSAEVLADGGWGELNGQLQIQLVGDAFLSPSRILCGHFLNESTQVLGDEVCQQVGISSARGDGIPCGANGGRYRAGRSPGLHARRTGDPELPSSAEWNLRRGVASLSALETEQAVCAGRGSRQRVRGETGKRGRGGGRDRALWTTTS